MFFFDLRFDDHGSLVIFRSASVRPKHLFDPYFDHDYFFKLPLTRERDAPSSARRFTARHVRYRAVPRTNRTPAPSSRAYQPNTARVERSRHCYAIKSLQTSPSCGYSQSLLSVWIVAPQNSLCRKLNCASLRKATPLRQVNLELSLTSH